MSAAASWYHCSVKPVSRSAGRSVVAAAAYRLGERLQDERYAATHDYTRRRGVESTFTIVPIDAPEWSKNAERLWNAAEQAETRINSTLAREVELALPAFLSPEERRSITEKYAGALVERYNVAVSVAIHEPGRGGDQRNYHAHILFSTREMTPDGLGKKTRILDDRKTGPQEVTKLRELAANLINEALADANSDIRVDHRSFKERGIEQEATTHLGPAASEMERRGEQTERGDMNRAAEQTNAMIAERNALGAGIVQEQERITSPPNTADDSRERGADIAAHYKRSIKHPHSRKRWQDAALSLARNAFNLARTFAQKISPFMARTGASERAQAKQGRARHRPMSSDADRSERSTGGRLWGNEPEPDRRKADRPPSDNVLPLTPLVDAGEDKKRGFPRDRVYVAFDAGNRLAERLHIVLADTWARNPAYSYLSDIAEDTFHESAFILRYPFMIVEVFGTNLGPVTHALAAGTCQRIRQYHAKLYDRPAKGEPFIEKIVITDIEALPDLKEQG